jgi:hypothetical protein
MVVLKDIVASEIVGTIELANKSVKLYEEKANSQAIDIDNIAAVRVAESLVVLRINELKSD